jgi:hypothetical protein
MRTKYGGAESYLRGTGLSSAEISTLRKKLIQS